MSLIEVSNLSKQYRRGKIKAVDDASFQVEEGEVFGLIGPNGAGKTTIFGCLLALMEPSAGKIQIAGRSPFDFEVKSLLGFLPERPCYNRWMTIYQFLAFQYWLSGRDQSYRQAEIKRVLDLVELDIDIKKRRVAELSRGMLQRIGLAQALIGRPSLLFLDEPTSGMDPLGFILIRKLLLRCKEDGMTVILNSHHLQEVEKICDRIAFIRKGKIEQLASVQDLAAVRQALIVEWLVPAGFGQGGEADGTAKTLAALARVAEASGCALVDSEDNTARFSCPDNEKAAEIVTAMAANNLRVYQSKFERRELVELFLTEQDDNSLKTNTEGGKK